MISFFLVILVLSIILIIEELGWKKKILHDEYQRKFLHMTTGSFMAFWPWLISWNQIEILAAIGVISALIYKKLNVFGGLSAIRRNGYGHFTHPLSVLVIALLTHRRLYFCLATLIMALADGLAAVVGSRYGGRWKYSIFGQTKTLVGSAVFWFTSLLILGVGLLYAQPVIDFAAYVALVSFLPPILTALEALGIYGTDNLIIPIAVIGALKLLS